MEVPKSLWAIIWQGIEHWKREKNLGINHLSLLTAGIKGPYHYPPDRIARGITDGCEPISMELVRRCVWIFSLVPARAGDQDHVPSDEECIKLLIAPVIENNEQGRLNI